MKFKFLLFLLIPFLSFSQVQIGNDIDGENSYVDDRFGKSVSLSSDGTIMAVAAPENDNSSRIDAGHVRVYENTGGVWTQIGNDIFDELTGGFFGESISLSSDGSIIAIGDYNKAFIYEYIGGVWTQIGDTIIGNEGGVNVSLSSDGSIVAVGNGGNSSILGFVSIYINMGGVWTQIGDNIESEAQSGPSGTIVSLSSNGSIVAIGVRRNDGNGRNSGHVRVFENIASIWTQVGDDIDGEVQGNLSGTSVSLSSDGSIVAIGAPFNDGNGSGSGHVRVYKNLAGIWTQIGNNINGEAQGDQSGTSLSLSSNGNTLVIGAPRNDGNGISSGHARVYNNIAGVWTQVGDDIDGEEEFNLSGESVSISSDGTIISIGASNNYDNGGNSGHVRAYENIAGVWTQIGDDIDGEKGVSADFSGSSVAISLDGNSLAIGAPGNDNSNGNLAGHVRIYENIGNIWSQVGNDIDGETQGNRFGSSVSLSSDANIVAIGAPRNDENGYVSGHVRLYENEMGVWTQIGNDIDGESQGDESGSSVSLSSDGSIVAIGAPFNDENGIDSGHVRMYENINDIWTQIGSDINGETEGDHLGLSVSLSSDGTVVAIGAPYNDENGSFSGHVRIYKNITGIWTQIGSDISGETEGDQSGSSVSLSSDGSIVAIGAPFNDGNGNTSGHVRVYKNIGGIWTQIGNDIDGEASRDQSGTSVSLSSDGSVVAIGAPSNDGNGPNSGHIRVYKNMGGIWTLIGNDIDGEDRVDQSGSSVSLSSNGSVVAIGAPSNDGNGTWSGHVRVYDLSALLSTKSFNQDYFSFYPNPVKNILNINLNKGLELKQINIYNIQSQYLYSSKTLKIDISNLQSGVYFVEVETNQGKSAKKIVVE